MLGPKKTKYIYIAEIIRNGIKNGDFPPGSLLPSQSHISLKFKTSVMTVRQALSVLEAEGLIEFKHGIGTFVASGGINRTDLVLHGFQDEMSEHRINIITKVIKKEYSCDNERIKELLAISDKEEMSCLTRLRLIRNRRTILQRTFVPSKYREVIKSYSEDKSLYTFLGNATGKIITQGREIIIPACLESEEAKLLNKNVGAPALLSYRLSTDLSGEPVLFDEAYLSGDSVAISVNRTGSQYRFHYAIVEDDGKDIKREFLNSQFWEEWA